MCIRDRSKPIGRKALGVATGYLDSEIGKFYNGGRQLTLETFTKICAELDVNVGSKVGNGPPIALLIAAHYWQAILIDRDRSKIKSLNILDQADYIKWWTLHRAERASQVKSGNVEWPLWLND